MPENLSNSNSFLEGCHSPFREGAGGVVRSIGGETILLNDVYRSSTHIKPHMSRIKHWK